VKKERMRTLILAVVILGGICLTVPSLARAEEGVTVQQSVITTLERHPRLKMLKANRIAVGYDYKKARGGLYPSLDLTGGTGYDEYSDISTRSLNDDDDWDHRTEAGAVLTQLLYDGGETFRQMDIDRSRMCSLDSRVFDNAESLALDAVIASLTDQVEGDQSWTQSNAAMIRVNWNLFNGGSDQAAERAAYYREREAAEDRNDILLTVIDEAQSTWDNYESSIEQRIRLAESVTYTDETRDMYMQQFVVGQRTLLDVLDIENEFYQYSGQLVTAQANERIAAFRMLALSGKLLRALDIDPQLYKDLRLDGRAGK
jgi:outer membrane protein TolC